VAAGLLILIRTITSQEIHMEIKISPTPVQEPNKDTRPMTEAELEAKKLEYELKNRLVNLGESVLGFIGQALAGRK
jgi:hypothetical protein